MIQSTLKHILKFFQNYATELAFYFSLILFALHPDANTLGFASLAFANFGHQRYTRSKSMDLHTTLQNNIQAIRQQTQEHIDKLNADTQIQLNEMQQSLRDTYEYVQKLQVQKQLTGKPAVVNPLANLNRFPKG